MKINEKAKIKIKKLKFNCTCQKEITYEEAFNTHWTCICKPVHEQNTNKKEAQKLTANKIIFNSLKRNINLSEGGQNSNSNKNNHQAQIINQTQNGDICLATLKETKKNNKGEIEEKSQTSVFNRYNCCNCTNCYQHCDFLNCNNSNFCNLIISRCKISNGENQDNCLESLCEK
jgi:hypothetical protein